jgi:hypothetical protein
MMQLMETRRATPEVPLADPSRPASGPPRPPHPLLKPKMDFDEHELEEAHATPSPPRSAAAGGGWPGAPAYASPRQARRTGSLPSHLAFFCGLNRILVSISPCGYNVLPPESEPRLRVGLSRHLVSREQSSDSKGTRHTEFRLNSPGAAFAEGAPAWRSGGGSPRTCCGTARPTSRPRATASTGARGARPKRTARRCVGLASALTSSLRLTSKH